MEVMTRNPRRNVIKNVFICSQDGAVEIEDTKEHNCPICNQPMEQAGWMEKAKEEQDTINA